MHTNIAMATFAVKQDPMAASHTAEHPAATRAARLTVADLVMLRVAAHADAPALQEGDRRWTYRELGDRVGRLARTMSETGVHRGARVAVLAENRHEYLEVKLAAACLGAIVACLNWRQTGVELERCLRLVEPKALFHSERHAAAIATMKHGVPTVIRFGDEYERRLGSTHARLEAVDVDPEDALIVLYTSGTTGPSKAALISHRAVIARSLVNALDRPVDRDDAFVAWTPLFHMGASDHALSTLMRGGKVILMDGFEATEMVRIVATERLGWLHVMPGMSDRLLEAAHAAKLQPKSVRYIGVMADLVPRERIAALTRRFNAPYINTFGSTEAGAIASRGQIPVGEAPDRLSKELSSLCRIRLVDAHDQEVPDGTPGEMTVRSPSLFSGYWGDTPDDRAKVFRGGWYRTGDVFSRRADGRLDFVDRRTYLIKSGGENIYPAEIENILLRSPRIADAVVVRRSDPQWGEVPIAFVARRDGDLTAGEVLALLDGELARYKRPRAVRFVDLEELPRSASGKVMRVELERRLQAETPANEGD
jgi:acyl-CoA synthetase (AMP-forming)/AMP-acid ligase II